MEKCNGKSYQNHQMWQKIEDAIIGGMGTGILERNKQRSL